MAAPILTLAAVAYDGAASFDLTALTGGVSGLETLAGFTGADWWTQNNSSGASERTKREGAGQLRPVLFNDSGVAPSTGTSTYMPKLWTPDDEAQTTACSAAFSDSWSVNLASSQINAGLKYAPPADQSLRTLRWIGSTGNGTWTVKASLSDASCPDQTLVLPINTHGWFDCTWRAKDACVLNLEVRCTASSSTAYAIPQLVYMPVPTPPPIPRGYKNLLRYAGISGGQNA